MNRWLHNFFLLQSLLFFLACLPGRLPANTPADSASCYFPLQTGDIWQYHYFYEDCCCFVDVSVFCTVEVTGDTTLPNGRQYKVLVSSAPSFIPGRILRIDSATANVYEFSGDTTTGDYIVDSLRADVGGEFRTRGGMPIECDRIDTASIMGIRTTTKHFVGGGMEYTLAYGLGLTRMVTMKFECQSWNFYTTELCYAKVQGVEYGSLVSVADRQNAPVQSFRLWQNYPNPFNSTTVIGYTVGEIRGQESGVSLVQLIVYDLLGREVAVLVNEKKAPGTYQVTFDARLPGGQPLASGVYICRIRAGNFAETMKLLLIR